MVPIAVNFHVLKACNARCRFCFATFRDVRNQLDPADARRLIVALRDAGAEKLNFAGGEPTLHPDIAGFVQLAKDLGFVTSIVTNGRRLDHLLDAVGDHLDWVGLSVDSGDERVQAALGRGTGDHVARAVGNADRCRELGLRIKLNSVVTSLTYQEDMAPVVRRIRPERWKAFQVLPMAGQNDGAVESLLITPEQFQGFVERHAALAVEGLAPIVEDDDAMRGSYMMIDPLGRFFGNATGRHVYSAPILQVGVEEALAQVGFVPEKFEARGGRYSW